MADANTPLSSDSTERAAHSGRMYSVVGIAVLLLIAWGIYKIGPGKSGIVLSGESTAGHEYCIVQRYTGVLTEPYQVSLYVRDDAGTWRWHYLAHEDGAWRSAEVKFDGDLAVVFRSGERVREVELVLDPIDKDSASFVDRERSLPAHLSVAQVALRHNERYQ